MVGMSELYIRGKGVRVGRISKCKKLVVNGDVYIEGVDEKIILEVKSGTKVEFDEPPKCVGLIVDDDAIVEGVDVLTIFPNIGEGAIVRAKRVPPILYRGNIRGEISYNSTDAELNPSELLAVLNRYLLHLMMLGVYEWKIPPDITSDYDFLNKKKAMESLRECLEDILMGVRKMGLVEGFKKKAKVKPKVKGDVSSIFEGGVLRIQNGEIFGEESSQNEIIAENSMAKIHLDYESLKNYKKGIDLRIVASNSEILISGKNMLTISSLEIFGYNSLIKFNGNLYVKDLLLKNIEGAKEDPKSIPLVVSGDLHVSKLRDSEYFSLDALGVRSIENCRHCKIHAKFIPYIVKNCSKIDISGAFSEDTVVDVLRAGISGSKDVSFVSKEAKEEILKYLKALQRYLDEVIGRDIEIL